MIDVCVAGHSGGIGHRYILALPLFAFLTIATCMVAFTAVGGIIVRVYCDTVACERIFGAWGAGSLAACMWCFACIIASAAIGIIGKGIDFDIVAKRGDVCICAGFADAFFAVFAFATVGFAVTTVTRVDTGVDRFIPAVGRAVSLLAFAVAADLSVWTSVVAFAAVIQIFLSVDDLISAVNLANAFDTSAILTELAIVAPVVAFPASVQARFCVVFDAIAFDGAQASAITAVLCRRASKTACAAIVFIG